MRKPRKRKSDQEKIEKLLDVFCKNIALIMIECKYYPGTQNFQDTYNSMLDGIAEELRIRVIKEIRKTLDV